MNARVHFEVRVGVGEEQIVDRHNEMPPELVKEIMDTRVKAYPGRVVQIVQVITLVLASGNWWTTLAHAHDKPCHIGRISGRERVRLVKSWGADSIDSCVPLWSEDNRNAVVLGLVDPPVEFDPPDPAQFLSGWEAL
jgi:hypothetical protein